MNNNTAVKVSNLTKIYKLYNKPIDRLKEALNPFKKIYHHNFYALNNVNFEIKKGETIGIIGKNGAGKSTLLKILTGVLTPTNGSVEINGKIASLLELGAGFNPEISGLENIYLNGTIMGFSKEEMDSKVDSILEFADIGEFVYQPVKMYSSGMFARLAFAVAINVEPDILIIDEALSVGDGSFAKKSFDSIIKLKDNGTTILFCSHSLYQVEAITNRIIWLNQGEVKIDTNSAIAISNYREFLNLENINIQKESKKSKPTNTNLASFIKIRTLVDGYESKILYLETLKSTLTIELEFEFSIEIETPTIGIVITQNSIPITSISSKEDDFIISEIKKGLSKVVIEIPKIPLLKGNYQVDVYLLCNLSIYVYDEVLNIATLEVQQKSLLLGYMAIEHKWKNKKISHIDFMFPLNLYAHLLYLDTKKLEYLHFGIFKKKTENILDAQRLATNIILEELSFYKGNTLEIGFGVGTTSQILIEKGFKYLGISQDEAQYSYVKDKFPLTKITLTRFEDFISNNNEYDIILFQESSQYIEPINLFFKALKILKIGGIILIMDEFVLNQDLKEVDYLTNLEYFITFGDRFGFKLVKKIDFSVEAMPTIDYLIKSLKTFYNEIKIDLNINIEQIKALEESLYKNKNFYETGKYGYFLLLFEKKETPQYILDKAHKYSDECRILFKNVFKEEMSREFWEWKYKRSLEDGVVLLKEGKVIGYYGGFVRDILFFGESKLAISPCDTMIDIKDRGEIGQNSKLSLLIKTFIENSTGYGNKYIISFGFPNERVMKLCKKSGLYKEVDKIIELKYSSSQLKFDKINISLISEKDAILIDNLWKKMSLEFLDDIIGVRDWFYLNHRYISNPKYEYKIYKIYNKNDNDIKAVIVLKIENSDNLKLMDIISLKKDYNLCVEVARYITYCLNYKSMSFWITSSKQNYFFAETIQMNNTNIPIAYIDYNTINFIPYRKIENRWWLTYGDTDFI